MRCIWAVATMFPESLLPAMLVRGELAWSPTDSCLAELVGRRAKTRPAFPIPLQIRACCRCTTKCLECRDSQPRHGLRELWDDVRKARAEYEVDKSTFEALDSAVKRFFEWEISRVRRDLLRAGSVPAVEEAKQALLSELRTQGVFVLEKGALEDYYPDTVIGPDKPSKAQAFRQRFTDRTSVRLLSRAYTCGKTAKATSEYECIFSRVFGDCIGTCDAKPLPA